MSEHVVSIHQSLRVPPRAGRPSQFVLTAACQDEGCRWRSSRSWLWASDLAAAREALRTLGDEHERGEVTT